MENIRERYKQLTGREPGRVLVVEGELEESVNKFISEHGTSNIGLRGVVQEEFIDIIRTEEGYEIHGVELQKSGKKVHKTYFEERNIPLGYLGASLNNLEIGDSLTLHLSGKSTEEITRKLDPYLHRRAVEPVAQSEVIPRGELAITLEVNNQYGIHARPATMIVRHCSQYDSDIEVELSGNRVSAKSIMGLMTLEATRGKKPTFYARGPDAKEAVDGLVKLFNENFGED